jgi:hypothetical protein
MNRPFKVHPSLDEFSHGRVLFAVELLDAVTLSRVSQGVKVKAHGLQGGPIVNEGGVFVWLYEEIGRLEKISIDPGTLPYEEAELKDDQLKLLREEVELKGAQLRTIELSPRVDYAFDAGITGLRGMLVEERVPEPQRPPPVHNAEVRLRWLDEFSTWHDAPTRSHTTAKGDFVAILRLAAPSDDPKLDHGKLTVRLRFKRDEDERGSADLKVLQGRVANPSTQDKFIFAWDQLQP